jgi:hypothetical protein
MSCFHSHIYAFANVYYLYRRYMDVPGIGPNAGGMGGEYEDVDPTAGFGELND